MSSILPSRAKMNNIIADINWNNTLQRGINSGLSLYDNQDYDLGLFKNIGSKTLEKINVVEINKKLDDAGGVTKTIENIGSSIGNAIENIGGKTGSSINDILGGTTNGLSDMLKNPLYIGGVVLLILLLLKK